MRATGAGYTLVELIVAMLILSVAMSIISISFSGIVRNSAKLMKSTETDIGGLIGLELMRRDLELAGFGLPYTVPSAVAYTEVTGSVELVKDCPGSTPSLYNDGTDDEGRKVPTPFRVGDNVGYNGSDYLVVKGTPLGTSGVSRGWGYLNYTSGGAVLKIPPGQTELALGKSQRAIVVKTGVAGGAAVRELVHRDASFTLTLNEPLDPHFMPTGSGDSYLVYGIDEADKGLELGFPFNRADYYLDKTGTVPRSCAKGTAILYKTHITHEGKYATYPLLDCVADLQVRFYWDIDNDGKIDYSSTLPEEVADLRSMLKELRVYVLAQQGRLDPRYSFPIGDPARAIEVGDRVWKESDLAAAFGANWRNYRWRLYTIVVQPKNL